MNTEEKIKYIKVIKNCIKNISFSIPTINIGFTRSLKPIYDIEVKFDNYNNTLLISAITMSEMYFNYGDSYKNSLIKYMYIRSFIRDYIENKTEYKAISDLEIDEKIVVYIDNLIRKINKSIVSKVKEIKKTKEYKDQKRKVILYYAEESMHRTFNSISKKYKKLGFSSEEIETMCKKYIDRAIIKGVLE